MDTRRRVKFKMSGDHREPERQGWFHQWASDYIAGSVLGIIEEDGGKVRVVPAEQIVFLPEKSGPQTK